MTSIKIMTAQEVIDNHRLCEGIPEYKNQYVAYLKHKEMIDELTKQRNDATRLLSEALNVLLMKTVTPINTENKK